MSAPLPWCISKQEKAYYEYEIDLHRSGNINFRNSGREATCVDVCAVHVVCVVWCDSNTYNYRQTQHARITLMYDRSELDIQRAEAVSLV